MRFRKRWRFKAGGQAHGVDAEVDVLDGVTHYDTHRFVTPLRRLLPWLRERWAQ
jgi:hypothetical protein